MSNVVMTKGVEFEMGWRFKTAPATPKDLTGFNVLVQIRPTKESSTILASYTEASPEITFIPVNGAVDLAIPPATVSAFTFRTAVIDCWVYNSVDGDRSPTYSITYDTGVSRL